MKYAFFEFIDNVFQKNKNAHILFSICCIIMYIYLRYFWGVTVNDFFELLLMVNWPEENNLILLLFAVLIYSYIIYITFISLYSNFNNWLYNILFRTKKNQFIIYKIIVNLIYILFFSFVLVITFLGIKENTIEIIFLLFCHFGFVSFSILLLCVLMIPKSYYKMFVVILLNLLYFLKSTIILKYIILGIAVFMLCREFDINFHKIIERK